MKSMKDKIATEKDRIAIGINKHHWKFSKLHTLTK